MIWDVTFIISAKDDHGGLSLKTVNCESYSNAKFTSFNDTLQKIMPELYNNTLHTIKEKVSVYFLMDIYLLLYTYGESWVVQIYVHEIDIHLNTRLLSCNWTVKSLLLGLQMPGAVWEYNVNKTRYKFLTNLSVVMKNTSLI